MNQKDKTQAPSLSSEVQRARFEAIARLASAFTNPVRIKLVALLMQVEEMSVDNLAARVDQSRANTSAQLKILLTANVVRCRRSGRQVLYRISGDGMREFWLSLQDRAAESDPVFNALVRSFYDDPTPLDTISGEEILDRARKGEVVLLDVRSEAEYLDGHIPGALSVPLDALKARLSTLSTERPLVAYCRGRYCVDAVRAVNLIREAGYDVRNLGAGITEWSNLELPVDRSQDA